MIGNLPDHDVYKDGLLLFASEESPASENLTERERSLLEIAYMLWVVVECVDWAEWTKQTKDWKASARKARDSYYDVLKEHPEEKSSVNSLSDFEVRLIGVSGMISSVIYEVSGGDWSKQSKDWQEAAAQWRDKYANFLKQLQEQLMPCH